MLSRRKQISITVRGRRSGRRITLLVWFVHDWRAMSLLPVRGSRSQWYRNLVARPSIGIRVGQQEVEAVVTLVTGRARVRPIVERFRSKYGRGQVARYYSRFDAAVRVPL